MDPSWHHHRPAPPPAPAPAPGGAPPPPRGTICPVCSISHFPFCPQPFPQNYPPIHHHHQQPRPYPDQFYPRPPQPQPRPPTTPPLPAYDPFADHHGGPGPVVDPPRQLLDSQRPPWSTNSGFDVDPHGVSYANDYYSNVGAKRMRFDNSGFSSSPAVTYANEHPLRPSADDERRLKLIRDHGGAMSADRSSGDKPKNAGFDRKGNFLGEESNVQKNDEGKFGQQYKVDNGVLRDNQLDSSLHKPNSYEYSRHSFSSVEHPRQSNESMGYNWQGVSGASAGYSDQRSVLGREFHTVDNQFVNKYAMHHGMEPKTNEYGMPYLNNQQPPLPFSPSPPLPTESPGQYRSEPVFSASPSGSSAPLFPICPSSAAAGLSPYPPVPEYKPNKGLLHASTGFVSEVCY